MIVSGHGTEPRHGRSLHPRTAAAGTVRGSAGDGRGASRPRDGELSLWHRVRREAGIEDVRLHDLRHTFASQAVISGIPVPVVSRMLGHSNVRMTLRYAHLGDREIEEAAETVGQAIAAIMKLDND
ncbi:MAG: tyrosine-type recombinase/integrase [Chloroflexota bacterium]|nr:tyrosine-type recombinase/integrase [Chloroflexota bacterium]